MAGALYAMLSCLRHERYLSGMDLAIFGQVARRVASGEAPYSEMKGADYLIFGDHLHPVVLLLGVPWRLWGDPRSLLVAQAVCVAIAVAIVGRLAVERLGTRLGLLLTVLLALSVGVQAAVVFDVHEVALGAPLVALAGADFVRRRWNRTAIWVALFPLVKEDMAVLVLGFALALLVAGRRRLAAALAVWAGVALVLALRVIIPALNPRGIYPYSGTTSVSPQHVWDSLVADGRGSITVLVLVASAGLLSLRSPLVLAAAAPLGLRMASSNDSYWGLDYHYSLLPAVVLACAAVDGLARTRSQALLRATVGLSVAVAVWAVWTGPLVDEVERQLTPCARCADARAALDQVPVGAEVAADDHLAPHLLADRTVLHVHPNYTDEETRRPEWMLLDRRTDTGRNAHGRAWSEELVEHSIEQDGYELVWERAGYVVLRR
ncbi:DUF2079 domain-containing protein [Janibacter indicus]|uniref:DUF2079 domain-containing protein n=1 Tax=Janibacter indicus TaxID=857417 RepID=UPI003D9A58ED